MKLSWKHKVAVYAPLITGNIVGLLNGLVSALLIEEHGVTLYTAPVAAFFAGFGLIAALIGWGISLRWKHRLEEYW